MAQDLVGLHGTDPASVFLAAGARMITGEPFVIERALYDERSLVRMLKYRSHRLVGRPNRRRLGATKRRRVAFRLLEGVGRDAVTAVAVAAERLSQRMGTVRVTPRFRTPLERELTA